ncbi:MAG: DUF1425 domain-containing protein [Phycisphaerales bacterium]|nr:DUF1425 domain-containing protein [Phycisphaerales bacterium]
MKRTIATGLSLLSLALLGACQTTTPYPNAGRPDPVMAPANNPRITVIQPELMELLGFDAPIVTKDQGRLRVAVPVRNLTDTRYTLDYKFTFYDEVGREVRPLFGYQEMILDAKEQRRPEATALDTTATDWRFQIKWANR